MKNIRDYLDKCNTYMFLGGLKENYADEKEVEEDIYLFLNGVEMLPQIKNQVDCDCPKGINKQNYTIDLVIKAEDGYLPIELKHSISATKEEIDEDIQKLKFYIHHYSDMPYGLLMYYTDKKNDPLANMLRPSFVIDNNKRRFFYLLVYRKGDMPNNLPNNNFDKRWDAKQ